MSGLANSLPPPHERQEMLKFSSKTLFCAAALAASFGSMAPQAAHASTPLRGFLFGIPSSTMSKADWSAFHNSAATLLAQMPAVVGHEQSWQGPTGAHGTVTIQRIFTKKDLPCRDIHAQFITKKTDRTLNYTVAVCRDDKGEWKLGS